MKIRWGNGRQAQYRAAESGDCRAHIDRIIQHLHRAGA